MIEVQLDPAIEVRLAADAAAQGLPPGELAGRMIERHYPPGRATPLKSPEEIRAWLDSLAQFSGDIPPLPDYAFTRASFYEDHD